MNVKSSAISRVALAFVVVIFFTLALHQVRATPQGAPDFPCIAPSSQEVAIEIKAGETGAEIGRILYENRVIKSSEVFFRLAVSNPRSSKIAPGQHMLNRNLCANDALDQLLDSSRIVGLINIFEGEWNTEIVDQMVSVGFDRKEVDLALASAVLPTGIEAIEGILFPAQYSFAKNTSASVAIDAMIARGKIALGKAGILAATGPYSPQELLTIASIVQAEADEVDFARVSRVIRNRLELGMPLQMDSTIHYIKSTRGKIFLSTKSTLLQSPFNTYRNRGLPPSPIGNPGQLALEAAMNPVLGDWIYFITVAPGDTRFTSSNSQFLTWKSEYKKNLAKGLFSRSKE
jgi:UPF0755 protein